MAQDAIVLVMEMLQGGDVFKRVMKFGRMPLCEAKELLRGMLSGLAYLHGKGIAHRDLKPENVMLRRKAVVGAITKRNKPDDAQGAVAIPRDGEDVIELDCQIRQRESRRKQDAARARALGDEAKALSIDRKRFREKKALEHDDRHMVRAGDVAIVDFGLATVIPEEGCKTLCGTPGEISWSPPLGAWIVWTFWPFAALSRALFCFCLALSSPSRPSRSTDSSAQSIMRLRYGHGGSAPKVLA